MADELTLKDFMLKWFKAYHLGNMDDGRRARWRDMHGKAFEINSKGDYVYLDDKRTGVQKGWTNPKTGDLATELPSPDLSDDDWKDFYRITRDTFREIDNKRKDLTRADPSNPLAIDKWFGKPETHAFSKQIIAPSVRKKLAALAKLAEEQSLFKSKIRSNLNFPSDYNLSSFLKDLESLKTEETFDNPQAFNLAQTLISNLPTWLNAYSFYGYKDYGALSDSTREAIIDIMLPGVPPDAPDRDNLLTAAFDSIQTALDSNNEEISPIQLAQFKRPEVWQEILKALYAPDKEGKKSPFHDQFARFGGQEITGWMDEIISGNDYDNGANALTPKLDKELNTVETIKEKITDYRKEHLDRLVDRSARHVYIEPRAEAVVGAIIKEKLTPQDGLIKFIEKKDAVITRVHNTNPDAEKGTKFLFEALEYIKSSGKADEMLAGALRNGRKAQAVALEIMKYALAKNKATEAKTALETLAVMRYDTLTSAHWKDLRKAEKDIHIFGDKGLSFNKDNPAMQIVTGALDGTLKAGLNAMFWAGVVVRNVIQHNRGKIKTTDRKRLATALVKIQADSDKFKNLETAQAELEAINAEVKATDTDIKADEALYKALEDSQKKIDALEEKISALPAEEAEDLKKDLEKEKAAHEKLTADAEKFAGRHEKVESLIASQRVAQEAYDRLKAAQDKGLAKETESKPYTPPKSAMQNMEMLMAFWNAANGYTDGIDVNSYNIFRNIKTVRKQNNLGLTFENMLRTGYDDR